MTSKIIITSLLCCCFWASLEAQTAVEKGDKQYELNNFEGATQSYAKALKATPNSDVIQSKLADTYRKMGKLDDAIAWYEKAAAKDDEATILQLGKMYMRKANYIKAKQTFAKISAKNADAKHFEENCTDALRILGDNSIYKVSNISALNTLFDDFMPSFAPNGEVVYLSSRNDMQRKGSKTPVGANQLFVSAFGEETFKKPAFFNPDLKNSYNEGPISEAGNYAVLTQNNFIGGISPMEMKGLELSMKKATIDKSGHWQSSQSLNLGGEGYANGFASLSADGQQLVFASDRPGGQGGFDLYQCKRSGEGWSVPINLGEVNTAGNEITPFLTGNNLYFSSDYHSGLGGYDVFRAEISNGIYNDLYHLGNQVNSAGDDYGFVFDKVRDYGVFTSNREGGKGGEDLYLVTTFAKNITLSCIDEEGKALANTKIDLSKCGEQVYTTNTDGEYVFHVVGDIDCVAAVSKEGYTSTNRTLKSNGSKAQNITIELKKAAPTYVGTVTDFDGNMVSEVLVRATNVATNKKVEAISDEKGKFALPLEANNDYLINFSKAAYVNFSLNKKDLDAKNRDLGIAKIKAVAEDYSTENVFLPKDTELAGITPKGGATINSKAKYTIQLASVKGKSINLSEFNNNLKDVGEVYILDAGNEVYKIRVGRFATREEAVDAAKKVQALGYKSMITPYLTEVSKDAPKKAPVPIGVKNKMSNYHVRLETLSKPENFDASKVEKIAQVTTMKSGNFTIFLLSGFKTLEDAREAKDAAIIAGHKGAFVVEKIGEKLTKVE